MFRIRCVVERITYQNPENGYSVLKVNVKGYDDLVTVVGNLLDACVGSVLLIEGEWKVDRRFGTEFSAVSWEEVMPATIYGMEKYLGSGLIKGIGPVYAKRIVSVFGLETITVIEDNIERLSEVPGLGSKKIATIRESWERQKEIKNIMLFLSGFGVSTAYAAKIFRAYGKESVETVQSNPFRLADDIWGIGFKTADTIAQKIGFDKEGFPRLRSGIIYSMGDISNLGHVYATREQLLDKAFEILNVDKEIISATVNRMIEDKDLVLDGDALYLTAFYNAETGVARRLRALLSHESSSELPFPLDIENLQRSTGLQYDPVQIDAVRTSLSSKVMVLTGGPGTGKTTTTLAIIHALKARGNKILLAAPTGRAAKRLSEATGMAASTLHVLLECKPPEGFRRNEENPIDGDVLIVDEFSMVDILLMNSLLKAVPRHMRLIMVGDVDQLPSVGPGNVLFDIIASTAVPVIRLQTIFRQAMQSRIVTNAHKINVGIFPDISNGASSDFFFIQEEDPEKVSKTVVDLVRQRLPARYGFKTDSIQVLTPMRRGVVGSVALNQKLQEALNDSGQCLTRGGYKFSSGDKVMQIKNDYDKGVFNGDIGVIVSVDLQERTLTVDYSGKIVNYEVSELDEITLAYAVTIHKSQGSEYPAVVIPLLMNHYVMLERNLLYTAVTRAKKLCVIIGTKKALGFAVSHMKAGTRNTLLRKRINP